MTGKPEIGRFPELLNGSDVGPILQQSATTCWIDARPNQCTPGDFSIAQLSTNVSADRAFYVEIKTILFLQFLLAHKRV